ncbi:hypothetical protein E2C01_002469 [Portunus trituberculatus]|uniref:Uncharacterized protein n=1 Tax=Portunus trituberculatus TaxID=210409 RepID=A0A5B7CM04_PORTR|nr:hypothetical protein [Portunus trituberculatus]
MTCGSAWLPAAQRGSGCAAELCNVPEDSFRKSCSVVSQGTCLSRGVGSREGPEQVVAVRTACGRERHGRNELRIYAISGKSDVIVVRDSRTEAQDQHRC